MYIINCVFYCIDAQFVLKHEHIIVVESKVQTEQINRKFHWCFVAFFFYHSEWTDELINIVELNGYHEIKQIF